MANGSKLGGIIIIALFIIVALAYIFLFNNKPAFMRGPASNSLSNPVASNSTSSNAVTHNTLPSNTPATAMTTQGSTTTIRTTPIYSIPITITNMQSESLPSGFQDMIIVNSSKYSKYMNPDWSNVEFTTGPEGSGTVVEAWVESNATSSSSATVVWLKLPSGITAHNSTVVYMDFMDFGVMSRNGPTGEAPQLSPVYAEYDNGGHVFNFYDNFSGRTLNRNLWTDYSSFSSNPITIDDGLLIGPSTSKQNNGYSALLSLQTFGRGVVDFYGTLSNSTQPHYQDIGLVPASSNNACNLIDIGSFYGPGYSGLQTIDSYCQAKYAQGLKFGKPEIYSIFVPSLEPNNASATVNYAERINLSFNALVLPQTIGIENQGGSTTLGPIYWIRQRDYPPGMQFPVATFGKLQ
jgi:hypothetical protein